MHYLLLIYVDEKVTANYSKGDFEAMRKEYGTFTQEIVKSGHLRAGEALQPVRTATTVRVRQGKAIKTDGPFAETKEQLGGFYVVEAKDLDEAIEIAARIPGAQHGSIEVRPINSMARAH
jgi:hypothetical protein